jgi:hypothetical protein
MLNLTRLRYALVGTLLLGTLAACGGSGSEGSTSDPATGSSGSGAGSSSVGGSSSSADVMVALSSNSYSVAAASSAIVTINRTGPSTGTASVSYTTANGSAMAGTDYVATSGTITWADGDSSAKTVNIPVESAASGKSFGLSLVSVSGQAYFGTPIVATIAIAAAPSGSSSGSKGTASSSSGTTGGSSSGTTGGSSSGTTGGSSSGVTGSSSSGAKGSSSSGVTGSSSSGAKGSSSSGATGSSSSGATGGSSSGSGIAFQLTAHASPGSVSSGQSITLTADLTAATAQSDMLVDLEVHDSSGTKIAQSYVQSQNFAAQETIPYTWTFTPASNVAAGNYVLEVGVFTAGWASQSFFNSSAATFTLTSASTPASTPKAALLNYLSSLRGNTGPHILIGQHTNYWDSVPTDDLTGLSQQTGKNPAIVGVMFDSGSSPEGVAGSPYSGVTLANTYLSEGYLVLITEVAGSPENGTPMWDQNPTPSTPMPAANFANVTTPGTAEYSAFQTYLQQLAAALKQINGTVLFRPFAEQNGSWFWYGAQNPSQFIAMWQMMHDYLVNAGVTNVLYVYATNSGVGNYAAYYPGQAYVDVVAEDAYPPSTYDSAVWSALAQVAPNAPQIYAEQGTNPNQSSSVIPTDSYDSETWVRFIEQNFPNVVGIVKWSQADALDNQTGSAAVMSDPQIITQELLPSSL